MLPIDYLCIFAFAVGVLHCDAHGKRKDINNRLKAIWFVNDDNQVRGNNILDRSNLKDAIPTKTLQLLRENLSPRILIDSKPDNKYDHERSSHNGHHRPLVRSAGKKSPDSRIKVTWFSNNKEKQHMPRSRFGSSGFERGQALGSDELGYSQLTDLPKINVEIDKKEHFSRYSNKIVNLGNDLPDLVVDYQPTAVQVIRRTDDPILDMDVEERSNFRKLENTDNVPDKHIQGLNKTRKYLRDRIGQSLDQESINTKKDAIDRRLRSIWLIKQKASLTNNNGNSRKELSRLKRDENLKDKSSSMNMDYRRKNDFNNMKEQNKLHKKLPDDRLRGTWFLRDSTEKGPIYRFLNTGNKSEIMRDEPAILKTSQGHSLKAIRGTWLRRQNTYSLEESIMSKFPTILVKYTPTSIIIPYKGGTNKKLNNNSLKKVSETTEKQDFINKMPLAEANSSDYKENYADEEKLVLRILFKLLTTSKNRKKLIYIVNAIIKYSALE